MSNNPKAASALQAFLCFIFAITVSGCVTTPPSTPIATIETTPSWLTTLPDSNEFTYAIGVADTQDTDIIQAKQQATAIGKTLLEKKVHTQLAQAEIVEPSYDSGQQTTLEMGLRERVRQEISPIKLAEITVNDTFLDKGSKKLFVLVRIATAQQQKIILDRYLELDSQLNEYIHASQKGSSLNQLMSIISALPTLEERLRLKAIVEKLYPQTAKLPNQKKADLMDRQINKLFNRLVFGVDALTAETEKLEPMLIEALTDTGLKISSRLPDITFKYYIEPSNTIQNKNYVMTLVNDIEFINRDASHFGALSNQTTGQALTLDEAQKIAMTTLAKQMNTLILDTMMERIHKVNTLLHAQEPKN